MPRPKRKGIERIGYVTPHGIEWNPKNWPLHFILRAIVHLKAARPML
jgi:hypothetical protein